MLYYITHSRIPTEKAHGMQIMKMCESFSAFADTELITPKKKNNVGMDPYEYYGVKKTFPIRRIPILDLGSRTRKFKKSFFLIDMLCFAGVLKFNLHASKRDILYFRDYMLLFFFPRKRFTLVVEVHDIPKRTVFFVRALRRSSSIIAITQGIKSELTRLGINPAKIVVAPDAVDLAMFDLPISKFEARTSVGLPQNKKIVLYSGHLYAWKGADVLAEAMRNAPEGIHVVFVGGSEPWITEFRARYGSIPHYQILPFQHRSRIPLYLKAADTLVLPNSGKERISSHYTSPLKLFEYMAAKRPIIASRLPSIREILNESNSVLFEPDSPQDLSAKILSLLNDTEHAKIIAEQACKDVRQYTWRRRAERILVFLRGTGN